MKKLLAYLNSLPSADRATFCSKCGTTEAYIRKATSAGQKIGESLCINFERESAGAVMCEDIRPDVDWAFLRASHPREAA